MSIAVAPGYRNWARNTAPEFVGGLTRICHDLAPPPEFTLTPMLDVLVLPSTDPWIDTSTNYSDEYLSKVYGDSDFYNGIGRCPVLLDSLWTLYQPDSRELRAHDTFLNLCALIDRDLEILRSQNALLIPDNSPAMKSSCQESLFLTWRRLNPNPLEPIFPHLEYGATSKAVLDSIYNGSNRTFDQIIKVQDRSVSLGEPNAKVNLANILFRINSEMVTRHMWGDDSKKSDRAGNSGSPLPLKDISPDMKKNYAIIFLAVLHGMIKYKLDNSGVNLLSRTWEDLLKRPVSPPFLHALDIAHEKTTQFPNPFSMGNNDSLTFRSLVVKLHCDVDSPSLWKNPVTGISDHAAAFFSESPDHKRNLALIAFSDIIGGNVSRFPEGMDRELSFRGDSRVLSNFTVTDPNLLFDRFKNLFKQLSASDEFNVMNSFGPHLRQRLSSFDNNRIFLSTRDAIEHGWTAAFRTSYQDSNALNWDATATAATFAVFDTISTFNDLNDSNKLQTICEKTHQLMTNYGLWGDDSKKPDRWDGNTNCPIAWDHLSDDYRANISLIVLSTIAGITNSMKNQHA